MISYVISYHISYHFISHRIVSCHITSYRIVSYTIPYHTIPYHIKYHIISHHITSHHITSHHITSHHIISYHIISYHIISHEKANISFISFYWKQISHLFMWSQTNGKFIVIFLYTRNQLWSPTRCKLFTHGKHNPHQKASQDIAYGSNNGTDRTMFATLCTEICA